MSSSSKTILILVGVIVVLGVIVNLGNDGGNDGGAPSSCVTMTQVEINTITTGNDPGSSTWTGSGSPNVQQAMKAPTANNSTFDMVGFLKVDAPGIESEVFTFVVGGDFDNVTGLLVGADALTREFWDWGAAATSGSPMAKAAADAAKGAPTCL